jgi:uncharacterized protein YjbI with pentapeptide repeats
MSSWKTSIAAIDTGEFTYQGQLKLNGVPINGVCDFEFTLWRDPASVLPADQIGPTLTFDGGAGNAPAIDVVNGLFAALLDFGPTAFNDDTRWIEVAVRCPSGVGEYSFLTPRDRVTGAPYSIHTRGIHVDETGKVGVGTDSPDTWLHVRGKGSFQGSHIAYFESTEDPSADGIAIQLDNSNTNRDNNFITFYNADRMVTGRIEGFDLQNGDWRSPPPLPDINLVFDTGIRINDPRDWLDPGALPSVNFTPGALPAANFTTGSLPTANFTPGTLPSLSFSGGSLPSLNFTPGTLPSLSFNDGNLPTLNFTQGTLPSLTFNRGSLPSLNINFFTGTYNFDTGTLPSATFNTGTLPSASLTGGQLPTATFNTGSLPTANFTPGTLPTANFTPGTLPSLTFSGGSLPSLSFTPGTLPSLSLNPGRLPAIVGDPIDIGRFELSFDLPTEADLAALFCWANENGVTDFLALDPVSIAAYRLKEQVAMVCKDEGVTYGSKGADYAEWLPKTNPSDKFQIGQIVGVHGGKVSFTTKDAEQIMAVSFAPVVVGNVPPEDQKDKFVTVGFMGQLPVVVHGRVKAGDYIIPSGMEDGTAVAVAPADLKLEHLGRTLGRAWSDSDNDIYSLINVVIGLPGSEAKIILERQRDSIGDQALRQSELAAENVRLKRQLDEVTGTLADVLVTLQSLEDRIAGQPACATSAITVAAGR